MQSLKDPNSVAAITDALRRVHGDAAARLMLVGGMTLANVITCLLRLSSSRRAASGSLLSLEFALGDVHARPRPAPCGTGWGSFHS